jgi:glycerol kinase
LIVPAFTGLGCPILEALTRAAPFTGISRGTTVAHIARAALESIAYQSAALARWRWAATPCRTDGSPVSELRVDGGACVNDLLMQIPGRPAGHTRGAPRRVIETTALGAAYLAGLSCGVYGGLDELAAHWQAERSFHPTMTRRRAAELMQGWEHAVAQTTL